MTLKLSLSWTSIACLIFTFFKSYVDLGNVIS